MRLKQENVGQSVVVELARQLDGYSAPDFELQVKEIIESGNARILLNCKEMAYISSAGLRAAIVSAKQCQQRNGKLTLCSLMQDCKSVFEISGFLSILDRYDTRESALTAAP